MAPLSAVDSVVRVPTSSQLIMTARRLVLKVGSSLLIDQKTGILRQIWLDSLVEDIAIAHQRGQEVTVVTSGAVASGCRTLDLSRRRLKLSEKQAAAAVGQINLLRAYQERLVKRGILAAQVLLTLEDSENRRRYLNARNTFSTLFRLGVVPVINENDTVATQELCFGDNDQLAARVAEMVDASILILFSDVDGLYTTNPHTDSTAIFIPEVRFITPDVEAMASTSSSIYGSGGMLTKLAAARICMETGCYMAIAPGNHLQPLQALVKGEQRCTWFIPSVGNTERTSARKRWIACTLRIAGTLTVDDGAAAALQSGSSLLPVGVIATKGHFTAGETVSVRDRAGYTIARGLIAYSSRETLKIMGRHTSEIADVLGYHGRDVLIHRDDLVLE